jgi:hypothetical protein
MNISVVDAEREIFDLIQKKIPDVDVEVEINKTTKDGERTISSIKVNASTDDARLRVSCDLHYTDGVGKLFIDQLDEKIDKFIKEAADNRIIKGIVDAIEETLKSSGFEYSNRGNIITIRHPHRDMSGNVPKLFEISTDMEKLMIILQYKENERFGDKDKCCYFMELADPESLNTEGIMKFIRKAIISEADKEIERLKERMSTLIDSKKEICDDDDNNDIARCAATVIPGWKQ